MAHWIFKIEDRKAYMHAVMHIYRVGPPFGRKVLKMIFCGVPTADLAGTVAAFCPSRHT